MPVSSDKVRDALLALEGSVISNFNFPLPGNLKDIAKAGDFVSGVVEDRIPELLNSVRAVTWDEDGELHAYEFRRFTIGFPDIFLVERANTDNVLFEVEAKSWYILGGDPLTARFKTAINAIRPGTIVAVVGWLLDGVVSGSPKLLRIFSDDAIRLATTRDQKWTAIDPPGSHRVVEPHNAPDTHRSAMRTQAVGQLLRGANWENDSDNYGKLDRLYDDQITKFRDDVWSLRAAGKSLGEWQTFIKRT